VKKRLLITVGDSYTLGVGSYNPLVVKVYNELLPTMSKEEKWAWEEIFHDYYLNHGWPTYLQKLLKCDHLINCSRGGSSNSGIVKTFMELYENETFSEYEVNLVWGMTWPERISFYAGAKTPFIKDHVPNMKQMSSVNDLLITESKPWDSLQKVNLRKAYVEFINNIPHDTVREALFYKSILHMMCKYRGWNFSFWWCDKSTRNYITKLHPGPEFYQDVVIPNESNGNIYKPLRVDDRHCNEEGYKKIAQDIFNAMQQRQPQCLPPNDYLVNEYSSEWTGMVKFHKPPL
jgi:hypothetical protein